jgi:hypothetical protein
MLTLDRSTLFYWNLTSFPPTKHYSASVDSWAKSIPVNAKPPSQAPSRAPTARSTTTINTVPSLTNASSRSTGRSVLTDTITVTGKGVPSIQVKSEHDVIDIHDGGLSDHDEINGHEREAALLSPPKGKKRMNSEVNIL